MDKEGEGHSKPRDSAEGGTSVGNGALGCLGQSVGGKCMEGGAAGWRGEAAGRLASGLALPRPAHPLQHQACLNRKLLPQADSLQGSSEEGSAVFTLP